MVEKIEKFLDHIVFTFLHSLTCAHNIKMDRNTLLAFFLIALVLIFTPYYMELVSPIPPPPSWYVIKNIQKSASFLREQIECFFKTTSRYTDWEIAQLLLVCHILSLCTTPYSSDGIWLILARLRSDLSEWSIFMGIRGGKNLFFIPTFYSNFLDRLFIRAG